MSSFLKGVLVINLGTPKSPKNGDVFDFLNEFLTDGRVIDLPYLKRQLLVRGIIVPFRYKNSANTYRKIWHPEKGSPLMYHSLEFMEKFRKKLPAGYVAELAMRYEQPSIESALEKLRVQNISELIVFPMYPQYASSSTGTVLQKVLEGVAKWNNIPHVQVISHLYQDENFLQSFVSNIRKYDISQYDHFLFSYHGVPLRHIKDADVSGQHCQQNGAGACCDQITSCNHMCYRAQCVATTNALAERIGLSKDQYSISFQSRLGKEEWVQPYTSDVISQLAKEGKKKVLVSCPAFVADCLETIFEIGVEYAEEFEEQGGEKLQLVESLNSSDQWVDTVVQLVTSKK